MEIEFCDYVTFVFFAFNYFIYNRAFAYALLCYVFGLLDGRRGGDPGENEICWFYYCATTLS